jgi:transposase
MSTLFYLSPGQITRIKPYFPLSHGVPRVDDRRIVSGIIYVIKHGLQWKDAPREYGRTKHSITVLSVGAAWEFSTKSLRNLLNKTARQHA